MREFTTIELRVVTRQVAKDGYDTQTVHLIVRDNMPVRLGSGRYAEVVAAASGRDVHTADQFFALKFLKHDRNSRTVSRNARRRYFEELDKTVQFGAERGRFVVYVGCARLKEVPEYAFVEGRKKEGAEEAFERRLRRQLDEIGKQNQQAIEGKVDPAFLAEVQGDFFAMKAEEGTLEDLLFDPRPWAQRAIFSVRPRLRRALEDKIQQHRDQVRRFLDDLRDPAIVRRINPRDAAHPRRSASTPANGSGFELLKYVGNFAPSVKNYIVLGLVRELADTIRQVHTNTGEDGQAPLEGWLAHRDLKPGNFLFSYAVGGPQLRVSDLGFVGGTEVIQAGMNSGAECVHEPGVLSPGSPLFRAPEQMPALEVRFEAEQDGSPRIHYANIGGIADAEVGDWFECQELGFGDGKAPQAKTRIDGIEESAGRVVLRLRDPVRLRRKASTNDTHVGYLVKSSGLHTDVFALGCILYLLASIGRNPEKFHLKCLEAVTPGMNANGRLGAIADPQHREGREFYELLHRDCLSLALALCVDRPDAIAEDLAGLLDNGSEAELVKVALLRPEVFAALGELRALDKRVLRAAHKRCKTEHAQLNRKGFEQYLHFLRGSPTTQFYLRDSNDEPLPLPIVWEIVRCLVRDRSDSYVQRPRPDEQSFFEIDGLHLTTGRIHRRLGTLLEKTRSATPDLTAYRSIDSGDAANMFFLLRICYERPAAAGAAAPPPRTAGGPAGERDGAEAAG